MASRAPLRLNHRCPVWFHSCRLRVEGKAFRPPFSCAKKPEADDKTVTIPLRAHEIWLPSEVRSRPLRLIPPSQPANLPPRIPHELRTTQTLAGLSPGGQRRTEEQPFPLPSPAIGPVRHRPPCPVCPLRLRRQTAPRQNNPVRAVAFALGLYYLYRRQTAPRQNNPASAVAFALGLYYLCQRTNAYPL